MNINDYGRAIVTADQKGRLNYHKLLNQLVKSISNEQ